MTLPKPDALEVWPRNIPHALKDVAGWVMWRWWWNGKKWTKPPFSIDGVKIDQTDRKNWVDYSTALQTYQKGGFDGIGFSLGAMDSLGGVDLDHCVKGGVIVPWALEIIDELGGYAEISPSGTGIRVFGLTSRKVKGRKKSDIEMYVDGRYLTVTGHKLDKSVSDLVDFGEAFGRVYDRIFPDSPKDSNSTTEEARVETNVGEDLADRFLAFMDDDPDFRERLQTPALVGDRSDHEFHLCARLWEGGFSESEIWSLMDSSPQSKWRERGDDYKAATIRNAISAARSSDGGRGQMGGGTTSGAVREKVGAYVADLPGGENLRVWRSKGHWYAEVSGGTFKPAIIADKPIWFDLRKWEKLPEKLGIDPGLWNQIRGDVRALEERRQAWEGGGDEDEEAVAGYSDDVMKRAGRILERGQPLSFLMEQYHKNHRGDGTMGRGWFCSFASGQSLTSNGIQPAAHSEDPGMGKTDSGKAAFHCIHTRADLETSVSAMSLYRDKTLRPGDIVFSDDVEWSRALASTVKRSMSNFQRETNHKTLDKDNELQSYSLPPRLLWWFTSVESSAIDQIIDRQFLFDVDNSEGHHRGVNDDIKARRASGNLKFDLDDDILTARAITFLIKKAGPFKVIIPFAGFIVWKLPRGHRDLNRFLDLIDALAILRYPQRDPQKGEDGTTWLTATIEDYREAKRIFASRQKNIRTHLTDAETRLITVMVERANWTQAELAERTGHNQGTISKRLSSLLEKSSYVKSWNEYGEKRFATTDKVDLSLFASDVVGLNLPTARSFIGTDIRERYSTIFHTYSYLIPISIPILTNSSRNNSGDLFHNPGFSQGEILIDPVNTVKDDRVTEDRNNDGISFGEGDGKNGINPQNQQHATDSTRNKSGIPVEYDGITLDDSEEAGSVDPPHKSIDEPRGAVDGEDRQSIAEELEEDRRRQAEEAERVRTPEPKPKLNGLTYSGGPAGEYSDISVNLYDGCTHRCDYCYNKVGPHRWKGTYGDPFRRIKKSSLPAIERDLRTLEAAGETGPVHFSFIGDSYDLGRDDDDLRAVLELFHKSGVSFQILTKGGMKAARDFDLYRPGDKFGCTLTFFDPVKSKEWEPGAALPEDRLRALEEAHKSGIETWASCEPVIDPAETLELIRRSHKFVDHFKVGRWNHDKRADGIDWHQFAGDVVELLDSLGCDYYIKDDLRRYLPPKGEGEEWGRSPTAEEAAVLEEVAGRILQNWGEIPEMLLWDRARSKLGSPLPHAVVRFWLRESGYNETKARHSSGGTLWNPPAAGVVG